MMSDEVSVFTQGCRNYEGKAVKEASREWWQITTPPVQCH